MQIAAQELFVVPSMPICLAGRESAVRGGGGGGVFREPRRDAPSGSHLPRPLSFCPARTSRHCFFPSCPLLRREGTQHGLGGAIPRGRRPGPERGPECCLPRKNMLAAPRLPLFPTSFCLQLFPIMSIQNMIPRCSPCSSGQVCEIPKQTPPKKNIAQRSGPFFPRGHHTRPLSPSTHS